MRPSLKQSNIASYIVFLKYRQTTTQSKNGGYEQNTHAIFSLLKNYADVLFNSYYGLFTETVRSGLPIELHHPTSKNSSSVSMVSVKCCDRISTYL